MVQQLRVLAALVDDSSSIFRSHMTLTAMNTEVPIYPVASAPAGARHQVEHMHTHRQTLIHKHNSANYICIFDGGIFNPNLISSFLWTNRYMCFSKCPLGTSLIMHFIFLYKNTKIHTFSKNRFISFSNLFKPLIPIIPVMPFFSDIISKEKNCTQVWSFKSALKLKVTPNIKSKFHRYTALLLTEVVGGRSIRWPQIPLSTVQRIFQAPVWRWGTGTTPCTWEAGIAVLTQCEETFWDLLKTQVVCV